MRFLQKLLKTIILCAGLLLCAKFLAAPMQQLFEGAQLPGDTQTSSNSTAPSTASSTPVSENTVTTPIAANVPTQELDNNYTYQFAANLPKAAKQAFTEAIAVYNAMGIVHLEPGTNNKISNQITFTTYQKEMPASQMNTIELGHGGPTIIKQTGWNSYTVNHAEASFNAAYPTSFTKSVAVHELGHALGLDHSMDLSSVMYPYDQGVTELSAGDLAGLIEIYQTK